MATLWVDDVIYLVLLVFTAWKRKVVRLEANGGKGGLWFSLNICVVVCYFGLAFTKISVHI